MATTAFRDELNRDLLSAFSGPVLRGIARGHHAPAIRELAAAFAGRKTRRLTYRRFFGAAYTHLWRRHRGEYLYKNAIARSLQERHAFSTSRMLCEFRIDEAKLDLLFVNGTTTGYEIKTELDSLDRLDAQLDCYCRVLDKVYVVTHREMVEQVVRAARSDVGVIELSDEGALIERRSASSHLDSLNPRSVFHALRRDEYLRILAKVGTPAPVLPNTQIYNVALSLFESLPPDVIHGGLVEQLLRRPLTPSVQRLVAAAPAPLKSLCVTAGLTDAEAKLLPNRLSAPIPPA